MHRKQTIASVAESLYSKLCRSTSTQKNFTDCSDQCPQRDGRLLRRFGLPTRLQPDKTVATFRTEVVLVIP